MDAITRKIWERWRAVGLMSLGAVFCLCLPVFFTVAGFVLLFICIPILLFWTPVQLTILLLEAFFRGVTANKLTPTSPLRTQNISQSRRTTGGKGLTSDRTSVSRSMSLTDAIAHGSPPSMPAIAGSYSVPNMLKNICDDTATTDITTPSVGEEIAILESPLEYVSEDIFRYTGNLLETLSVDILEEIAGYLPYGSIRSLSLVSKKFGTQFRFRHVHSGTERSSIPKFTLIANEPQLGQYTIHMIIHHTFYLPPVKVQWLLDGSALPVAEASLYATEDSKLRLLGIVLKACPRIRSLTWNEGDLQLYPTILDALQTRLTTSLRHLDINVDSQFLRHLCKPTVSPPGSVHLTSLTLRGGFSAVSAGDVTKLFSLTAASIRYVRFVDPCFHQYELGPNVFTTLMEEPSGLRRLDIINPLGLDITAIPLAQAGEGFELFVHSADNFLYTWDSRPILSDAILNNLTSFVLSRDANPWDSGLPGIIQVISVAVNLRVFSWNCSIAPHSFVRQDRASEDTVLLHEFFTLLTKRVRLTSLSLSCLTTSHYQIKLICEALENLSHLCVLMEGKATQISRYSQHFSKLKNLVALDVILNPMVRGSCACGHEDVPRAPHIYEGSAMGRLCRRFILKPPTELKIVRLSQNGWPPESHAHWVSKPVIQWIGSRDEAMRKFETICGLCENEDETIQNFFDPRSWMTTQ